MKLKELYKSWELGEYEVYINLKPKLDDQRYELGGTLLRDEDPKYKKTALTLHLFVAELYVSLKPRYRPATPKDIHVSHVMREGKCAQCLLKQYPNYVENNLRYECEVVYGVTDAMVHESHCLGQEQKYMNEEVGRRCFYCTAEYRQSFEGDRMHPKLLKMCKPT